MRLILILIFIAFSFEANSFEYKIEQQSLIHPSIFQRHKLSRIFSDAGYTSLTDLGLNKSGFLIDGVYTSNKWNKSLLIKAGLEVPESIQGLIIEQRSLGLQAFHFEFEGTPYLLVAVNLSHGELTEIIKPLMKKKPSYSRSVFLPIAFANNSCEIKTTNVQGFKETVTHIQDNAILQSIGKCAVNALQEIGQSTSDTIDFFKKVSSNPLLLWSEMKDSYNELKQLTLLMGSEINQIFQSFEIFTPEERAKFACSMTGRLFSKAAKKAFSPGGLLLLLPSMLDQIKKTSEMMKQLALLEGKGFKLPERSFLINGALSCVK